MQPELKARHITTLEFYFTVALKYELVKKIRNISFLNDEGEAVFFDTYKYHRIIATVKGIKQKSKEYNIEFSFQALSGGYLPKYFPRVPQLLEILYPLTKQHNFECVVSFLFNKNLRPKSVVNLPIKYSLGSDMPFDKVQGMHLVKANGQDNRYDIYIDAPEDGICSLNINFTYPSNFDKSLPDKVLDSAELVAKSIILCKERHPKEQKS